MCIRDSARGFNRSKSLEDLKLELYDLSAKGYKEVVLVGIDLSSYGKDIGCHLDVYKRQSQLSADDG